MCVLRAERGGGWGGDLLFITIICLSGSGEISGLFEAGLDEAWSVACGARDVGPISSSSNPCLHPAYTLSLIFPSQSFILSRIILDPPEP